MRAVIQRVREASVEVGDRKVGAIGPGLLVLLGVEEADTREDADWLAGKIAALRIFDDAGGVMNLAVNDVEGKVLAVSQFTLHAKVKKGARPSYVYAAKPEVAIPMYEYFVARLKTLVSAGVETGEFGANMQVHLINDGPVTFHLRA